MPKTELAVALDYADVEQAQKTIQALDGLPVILKIGSELFLAGGPDFVRELTSSGKRVFLDLKFHDIPNTVAKAAGQAARLGIEMFTVHLAGGKAMVEAIRSELASHPKKPKVLGVTVLTSFDSTGWNEVTQALAGANAKIEASVENLAKAAQTWGADGLVSSAHELPRVHSAAPKLWKVVPGIRPAGSAANDQARVMSPTEAARAGAGAIVVGRPITQAKDPRKATEEILTELGNAK